MDNDAFLRCPGGPVRVVEVAPDCSMGEQMVYFDGDDVETVYTTFKPGLGLLPDGRVRVPFDQPNNMREFHMKDPDRCLLLFGGRYCPFPLKPACA